jgi:excisionase family DNA binding protein
MSNHLRADGRFRGGESAPPTPSDPSAVLAYSIPNAAARIGISRSYFYELIRAGKIPIIKVGARSLVGDHDLRVFLDRHRVTTPHAGDAS